MSQCGALEHNFCSVGRAELEEANTGNGVHHPVHFEIPPTFAALRFPEPNRETKSHILVIKLWVETGQKHLLNI